MQQRVLKALLTVTGLFVLQGCTGGQDRLYKNLSKEDRGNVLYKGHYKIGDQYQIKGQSHTPAHNSKYQEVGVASWYGLKNGFHGKKTANGDKYNKHVLTAAHRTLPMPSLVKVTNLNNNKSLVVMINDRGPFVKGRILDVSEQAANILGFKRQGTAKVHVEYLDKETKKFLQDISLPSKPNSLAKAKVKNHKCSINCHIKLVNLKHQLAVTP